MTRIIFGKVGKIGNFGAVGDGTAAVTRVILVKLVK